jgi:hypothetical protein
MHLPSYRKRQSPIYGVTDLGQTRSAWAPTPSGPTLTHLTVTTRVAVTVIVTVRGVTVLCVIPTHMAQMSIITFHCTQISREAFLVTLDEPRARLLGHSPVRESSSASIVYLMLDEPRARLLGHSPVPVRESTARSASLINQG